MNVVSERETRNVRFAVRKIFCSTYLLNFLIAFLKFEQKLRAPAVVGCAVVVCGKCVWVSECEVADVCAMARWLDGSLVCSIE